ncbi:hypothetical protein CCMSSC00406_0008754 [Pleurotus cornucopiae]|uniref:Uncharacterized protein n=1 Tax=Pleurotus cornucopiae TaxID=5321 RepID=A0ACB7J3D5_PLECO|nr:hypothetical protein CCMSSC00406_0008754 [Pleurotus cornucopiae]
MINYLYILASLSLFHTALGAVAAAPGAQNGTDASSVHLVDRDIFGEQVVSVNATNKELFALQLPDSSHTDIDKSKTFDSTRVWHSNGSTANGGYTLAQGFFNTSATSKEGGRKNAGFVQLSGCINLDKAPQLNPSDKGGFYRDSRPSVGQNANFEGSRCEGYKHFVECVQPSNGQFILRCCNDEEDCPAPSGSQKCSDVLNGSYGACAEAKA